MLVILSISSCTNIANPFDDPNNATASLIIVDSKLLASTGNEVFDTVGNTLKIGVCAYLPNFVDSVRVSITAGIVDTTFKIEKFSSEIDTHWCPIVLKKIGVHYVSARAYFKGGNLRDYSGRITIAGKNLVPVVKPTTATANEGEMVTFVVSVQGDTNLTYQWSHNKSPLIGKTGPGLGLNNLTVTDSGLYSCRVIDEFGDSVFSSPVYLTVIPKSITKANTKPGLTVLGRKSYLEGEICTLSVAVVDPDSGTSDSVAVLKAPAGYTYNNNVFIYKPIAGFIGTDSVIFTAIDNGIPPLADTLTVQFTVSKTMPGNEGPGIITQPINQTVKAGTSVTFTVVASGTPLPSYQWRKNGVNCTSPSAVTASLTIDPATIRDTGTYTVILTNPVGTLTSSGASLTITSTPVITVNAPTLTNDSSYVTEANPVITGTAASEAGVQGLTAKIDGNGIAVTGLTNWSLSLAGITKKVWHSISISETDSAGKSITKSFQIFYRPVLSKPNPTALITATSRAISISWPFVSNCEKYCIYRSANGILGSYTLIKDTASTGMVDSMLKIDKEYCYKIRGYYSIGTSKYSRDTTEFSDPANFSTKNWFQHVYNISESGTSVIQWPDSGYVFCMSNYNGTATGRAMIMKINSSSDSLWCNSYGTISCGLNTICRVESDGGILSGGFTTANSRSIDYLLKTDALGNIGTANTWSKSFTGGIIYSILQSKNSASPGFVATGYTYVAMLGAVTRWGKCTPAGDSIWAKSMFPYEAYSSTATTDGNYVLAIGGNAPGIAKFNEVGDTLWTKYYNLGFYFHSKSIRETYDKGFFMVVDSQYSPFSSYLIKTNSYGDSLWLKSLGNMTISGNNSFQKLANGNFALIGNTATSEPNTIKLLILDPNGVILLSKTYSNAGIANSIQQTFDGGFIICGSKGGKVQLIKTDVNGDIGP